MKVGVIGAGPAGLCAIKHSLSFGCEVMAFEQCDKIGGTWVYTDEVDKDKNGLDVHSSMYQGLLTNLPKEIMGFPDFPFPTYEKSFVPSEEVLKYLHLFAETFDLLKYVSFEHHVVRVRPLLNDKWEFIVNDLAADKWKTYVFDAVLICNGFSVPYLPKLPGRDLFKGKQIHSHRFRNAKKFANEKVLVIGGGPSGLDITKEIGKVASRVVWSNHIVEKVGKKINLNLPENALEKPDVLRFTVDGAEFVDGSFEEFSIIFYATGYDYTFLFLSVDCGLSCYDKYVQPLYKHCISINKPSLAIIGVPYFALANPLFDLQLRFCLTFMTGKKQLPSRDEMFKDMEQDMNERWSRMPRRNSHFLGLDKHEAYYEEIAKTADIPSIRPVTVNIFNESFRKYLDNFTTFRDFSYKIIDDESFAISPSVLSRKENALQ